MEVRSFLEASFNLLLSTVLFLPARWGRRMHRHLGTTMCYNKSRSEAEGRLGVSKACQYLCFQKFKVNLCTMLRIQRMTIYQATVICQHSLYMTSSLSHKRILNFTNEVSNREFKEVTYSGYSSRSDEARIQSHACLASEPVLLSLAL